MTQLITFYILLTYSFESSVSSPIFLKTLISQITSSSILFITSTTLLYILTSDVKILLLKQEGFINVLIGLITRKMCKDTTPRRFIFVEIKGKYYPIAFTFMITFIGGLRFDYIINLVVGYAIGLEKVKDYVGDFFFIYVERICKNIENESGYISIENVGEELPSFQTRDDARAGGVNTIASNEITSKRTGGGGGFKAPGKIVKPKFPGGGRTLGTNEGDRNRNN